MKLLFSMAATTLLAGCAAMSGLDASSSFSCKAPAGVSCQSISGVQANAAQGNLPFQKEDPATTYGPGDTEKEGGVAGKGQVIRYGGSTADADKVSPRDMVAAHTGMPVRQPPLVLRVWMAPYEDEDKDLHDQAYFYTVVHTGRWMIEANTSALSNQFRPVYPLTRPAKTTEPEPPQNTSQPLIRKGDYTNPSINPNLQDH